MKRDYIKRLVSTATSIVMIFSCLAGVITVNADNKNFELGNMSCVLSDDGTLTVSGTGEMSTVAATSRPWKKGTCTVEEIKKIVVSKGITEVRNFSNLTSLVFVELAESVTSIQAQAFNGCTNSELIIDIKGKITNVNATKPFGDVQGTIYVYDTNSLNLVQAQAKTATVTLKVDISELKETLRTLINETKEKYKQEDYTEASYKTLSETLTKAEDVISNDQATADNITEATNAINGAVSKLISVVDQLKKELQEAITKARAITLTGYTTSSKAALNKAISDAETAIEESGVTKEKLTQAKTALEAASKVDETGVAETGLKVKASVEGLQRRDEALNNAVYTINRKDYYTVESFAIFKEAYDKLDEIRNKNDDITDQQIDALITDLNAAKEQLEEVGEITFNLEEYNAAKKAVEDILNAENSPYTKKSLESLKSIYDSQKSIIEDETGKIIDGVIQSRINSIVDILKRCIDPIDSSCPLVEKGNLTNIQSLVDSTKDLTEANYTAETWKALSDEKEKAEALISDPDNVAKADVEASEEALTKAIDALAYKPADYKAVDDALAKVPSDLSKYTDETVKKLKDAINAVDKNKNITEQADVDAFAKAIENAIAGLKLKPASISKTGTSGKSSAVKSASQLKAEKAMNQAKITKLTVKSKAKKTIVVKWNKVKNAKGYQVQVSTKKTFKKLIINKKSVKKNKITIKNKKLKKGKKYFVRVRAYATYKNSKGITKKAYSSWNKKLRTVKIK